MGAAELRSGVCRQLDSTWRVSRRCSSSDVSRAAASCALRSSRSRDSACTSAALLQPCVPTDGRVATARSSASGIASQLSIMRLCYPEFNRPGVCRSWRSVTG